MKKIPVFPALFLASALFLFTACNKDDNNDPPKSKTTLLTQATWKFKSASANGTDVSGLIQACQKDNIFTFSVSGAGNMNEGATKCNGSDPDNTPYTWAFASGETLINVSTPLFTNGGTSFTLISLSETELVVQMPYNPPVGASVLMTVTFNH